ncbi:hypothetical protein ACQJBY_057235 [Aegilops geniculata]
MAAAPAGVACPVYPWPSDAAQRGAKVFMQSDCAACHSALPYAGLRGAALLGEVQVGAMTAEILLAAAATEEAPAAATGMTPPQYTPDLATVATRIQGGLRCNLYSAGTAATPVRAMLAGGAAACQELKKSPVWLQFAQAFQAA